MGRFNGMSADYIDAPDEEAKLRVVKRYLEERDDECAKIADQGKFIDAIPAIDTALFSVPRTRNDRIGTLVEWHFEDGFDKHLFYFSVLTTGPWKRIKKCKLLNEDFSGIAARTFIQSKERLAEEIRESRRVEGVDDVDLAQNMGIPVAMLDSIVDMPPPDDKAPSRKGSAPLGKKKNAESAHKKIVERQREVTVAPEDERKILVALLEDLERVATRAEFISAVALYLLEKDRAI